MPIADIVLAVDEPSDSTRCTPNQPLSCRNSEVRCLTHDLWEELGNQMYLYLRSVTLEDVIKQRVLATCGAFPVDEAAAKRPAG
jgi:Rrf2 family iron-sulfur cluster assembly transcriptional regulator